MLWKNALGEFISGKMRNEWKLDHMQLQLKQAVRSNSFMKLQTLNRLELCKLLPKHEKRKLVAELAEYKRLMLIR